MNGIPRMLGQVGKQARDLRGGPAANSLCLTSIRRRFDAIEMVVRIRTSCTTEPS